MRKSLAEKSPLNQQTVLMPSFLLSLALRTRFNSGLGGDREGTLPELCLPKGLWAKPVFLLAFRKSLPECQGVQGNQDRR